MTTPESPLSGVELSIFQRRDLLTLYRIGADGARITSIRQTRMKWTARTAYFTCDTNPTVEQPFCVPLLAQILKM